MVIALDNPWIGAKDGDDRVRGIFERHYSRYHYKDGRRPKMFMGPGEKMVLITQDCSAIWGWRKFIDASGQQGVNNAIFHREYWCKIIASELIKAAVEMAWRRWPGERLYTYIDAKATEKRRSKNSQPGECYLKAGWSFCGYTKGGLVILELMK